MSDPLDAGAPPALLTVATVARELSISARSVWRLIGLGELQVVRIGRSVRVTRTSLADFIARGGCR
jgi:excisionase family DNA binding protein